VEQKTNYQSALEISQGEKIMLNKLPIIILIFLCGCATKTELPRSSKELNICLDSLCDSVVIDTTCVIEMWQETTIKEVKTIPIIIEGDTFLYDVYKLHTVQRRIY